MRHAPGIIAGGQKHGGAYTAKAVHFDGDNSVIYIPLSGVSTSKLFASWWMANAPNTDTMGTDGSGNDTIVLASFPSNTVEIASGVNSGSSYLFATVTDGGDYNDFLASTNNVLPIGSTWQHFAFVGDFSGSGTASFYQNGSLMDTLPLTAEGAASPSLGPFSTLSAATSFMVGSDGYQDWSVFDLADVQLWIDIAPDLSNPANIAKLISGGKPVDPSVAATAFGTQKLLLSGDHSHFGNQGSFGASTLNRVRTVNGRNGAGAITLAGAVSGETVSRVILDHDAGPHDASSSFESVISVNGQIHQSSASDLSANQYDVYLPGTLTDAPTTPSS